VLSPKAPMGAAHRSWSNRAHETTSAHPRCSRAARLCRSQIAHIEHIKTQKPYLEGNEAVVGLADRAGARTVLIVPMLKEDDLLGQIFSNRKEVRPFPEK